MRLLVVDDDRGLRDVLRRTLTLAGYEVRLSQTGADALAQIADGEPEAVVLDIGLPDIDGLEVCRLLRAEGNRVPVLMLTARDAVSDRIDGLDAGADDYLVKPFDVDELGARLRALLRRSGAQSLAGGGPNGGLAFADLVLDPARHGVEVGPAAGEQARRFIELTRTEYQLLELLMLNPRRVLPHSLIYDRVWGYDFGPSSNALRVYVGYLRRKLEEAGAHAGIHTLRGIGYALRDGAGEEGG
jgi:two-component system response regulator MprA